MLWLSSTGVKCSSSFYAHLISYSFESSFHIKEQLFWTWVLTLLLMPDVFGIISILFLTPPTKGTKCIHTACYTNCTFVLFLSESLPSHIRQCSTQTTLCFWHRPDIHACPIVVRGQFWRGKHELLHIPTWKWLSLAETLSWNQIKAENCKCFSILP